MIEFHHLGFRQICGGCPESYEIIDADGAQVGYAHLRNHCFTVRTPDSAGVEIYESFTHGDGVFSRDERDGELEAAAFAVRRHFDPDYDGFAVARRDDPSP